MEQIPTEVKCLIDALNKQIKELEIECEGKEKEIAELSKALNEMTGSWLEKSKIIATQSQRISEIEAEKERLKVMVKTQFFKGYDDDFQHSLWEEYAKENNL